MNPIKAKLGERVNMTYDGTVIEVYVDGKLNQVVNTKDWNGTVEFE